MEYFKILGLLLLISFITNASCYYEEDFQIESLSLTTIFPEPDETINIQIEVNSEGFSTSTLRIFFDEGYFTQLLIEKEIYLSKGENVFNYNIKIPKTVSYDACSIKIEIGNTNEVVGLRIDNQYEELITQFEEDGMFKLQMKSEDAIRFRITKNGERIITVRPVNGTVTLNLDKCEKCEMLIEFNYMGEEIKLYKNFNEYEKSFVRIKRIEGKEIEFVSCPVRNIENIKYESGYEKIRIEGHEFDLSKFHSEEKNEIKILENNPLKILVIAKDELNRNVKTRGSILLECDGDVFTRDVEFTGEKEISFELLRNTTCNITYNDIEILSVDVFMGEFKKAEEPSQEIIYWDDYITYGLILLSIIVTGLLFYKWRSMNK